MQPDALLKQAQTDGFAEQAGPDQGDGSVGGGQSCDSRYLTSNYSNGLMANSERLGRCLLVMDFLD